MTNSNGQGGSALSLDERKRAARSRALAILQGCNPAAGLAVAGQIRPHLPPGATVAGFHPMGRELDITALLIALRAAGHAVALPRTPPRGYPLGFHRWDAGDPLTRERFGTMTANGPAIVPDILLVPLLAWDRRGNRLGYGGGFYDRTIAAMPGIPTIGCAYAALEVPCVPAGPTDAVLGAVATETEFIAIEASTDKAGPCASCS